MDLHGNITVRKNNNGGAPEKPKEGLENGAGTYILRDGKLIQGKAEIRE